MSTYTVLVKDGLGNRLFQIASIYGLAKLHNRDFVLDGIDSNKHSNLSYDFILNKFKRQARKWKLYELPVGIAHKFHSINQQEQDTQFIGWFQSEKYFLHVADDIRDFFQPTQEIRDYILNKYPDIKNGFFIHVRRGDYLCTPLHCIDLDYYYSKVIENMGDDIHYYIMSDDIEWCKQYRRFNKLQNITYVKEDEISTLYCMSMCEYGGATANSTLSWWGVWLNNSPNKKMYMPNKWFNTDSFNSIDIYPIGSIQIEITL